MRELVYISICLMVLGLSNVRAEEISNTEKLEATKKQLLGIGGNLLNLGAGLAAFRAPAPLVKLPAGFLAIKSVADLGVRLHNIYGINIKGELPITDSVIALAYYHMKEADKMNIAEKNEVLFIGQLADGSATYLAGLGVMTLALGSKVSHLQNFDAMAQALKGNVTAAIAVVPTTAKGFYDVNLPSKYPNSTK